MVSAQTHQRQQRATAARLLLSLHGQGNLDQPERWTWDALDRLPAWCLSDSTERQQLQQVCGALYLSPDIRFWIEKPALQALQSIIGEQVFTQIMNHADAMALPREPLATVMNNAAFNPSSVQITELLELLMAAGATVLSATVHESLPRDMLVSSLGEGVGELNAEAAHALHDVAVVLLQSSAEATSVTNNNGGAV